MERQHDEYFPNISLFSNCKTYNTQDFAVFDFLRAHFYDNTTDKSRLRLFFCGAVAGVCSMTATTPIEFVR